MKLVVPFLVSAALLAAGCGGTQQAGTGASDIVPVWVPAFIQVDTDPGSAQWKAVDALARHFPDKQKGVDAIKKQLRSSGGLDWAKDVKPALGPELDLVWLDFGNGGQDFVALLQPKNESKFADLVRKGNEGDSTKVVYEKFRGWEVASDNRATIARFEQASKAAQASLSTNVYFQRATQELGNAVLRAYVNGQAVMTKFSTAVHTSTEDVVNKFGGLDWLGANLGATSKGISMNVVVHGTPGKLFKGIHFTSYRSHLAQTVPQDALLYWTFHGSGGLFGNLTSPVLSAPQFRPFRDVLNQIGKLMAGEDALYVRPARTREIPEITLVTEPAAGTNGRTALTRLIERYRSQLHVVPQLSTISGTAAVTLPFGKFAIRYANVGRRLVVTDLPQGIVGAERGAKLSQSADYQDALQSAGVPSKTQGYLYVNVHSTVPLVEHLANAHLPAEISRNLAPLRSALEYEVARSHELEVSFFLRIK
jgi:hypothetical protein